MNSITFVNGKTEKNTLKDFQMLLMSGLEEDDKKTFGFIMRYNSKPINARINELKELLKDPIDTYFDDLTANKRKIKWSVFVNEDSNIKMVGVRVCLSYENPLKETKKEEIKEEKKVEEESKKEEVKKDIPKENKNKKDMPKENKKVNKEENKEENKEVNKEIAKETSIDAGIEII